MRTKYLPPASEYLLHPTIHNNHQIDWYSNNSIKSRQRYIYDRCRMRRYRHRLVSFNTEHPTEVLTNDRVQHNMALGTKSAPYYKWSDYYWAIPASGFLQQSFCEFHGHSRHYAGESRPDSRMQSETGVTGVWLKSGEAWASYHRCFWFEAYGLEMLTIER